MSILGGEIPPSCLQDLGPFIILFSVTVGLGVTQLTLPNPH